MASFDALRSFGLCGAWKRERRSNAALVLTGKLRNWLEWQARTQEGRQRNLVVRPRIWLEWGLVVMEMAGPAAVVLSIAVCPPQDCLYGCNLIPPL